MSKQKLSSIITCLLLLALGSILIADVSIIYDINTPIFLTFSIFYGWLIGELYLKLSSDANIKPRIQ